MRGPVPGRQTRLSLVQVAQRGARSALRPAVSFVLVVTALLAMAGTITVSAPFAAAVPLPRDTSAQDADGGDATATPAAQVAAASASASESADVSDASPSVAASSEASPSATTPAASTSATPTRAASATSNPSAASGPATTPSIASDLADYPPGGVVTLTGEGWQPGEIVAIVVNDTGGLTWKLTKDAVADADGRIALTFTLPDAYVPNYEVTATGPVSGTAVTTFTDALAYTYWMQESSPTGGTTVTGGTQITYNLYGQRTTTAVSATITLTLTGSATFDSSGQNSAITVSADGKTATWATSSLVWWSATTVAVKATVDSLAPTGSLTATVSGDGTLSTSGTRFQTRTHAVSGPVVNTCDFADAGSGAYSNSICWFDLTGYNAATASSANGQTMRQNLPGGYTLTYTITAIGSTVAASTLPTWQGAYLGNTASGVGGYYGISGRPALYQAAAGTTTLTLTGITLQDSSGTAVSGFALVGADAESSDNGESITWTSNKTLVPIGPLGNACRGTLVWSNGNKTALCNGLQSGATKTGTAILYSQDPTTFTQTMVGGGLQAVGFGVMVSGVQLKKAVVNPVSATDGFTISVAPSEQGAVLGSATANAASNWTADTGQLYWIAAGSNQDFIMSETTVGTTDSANYEPTWVCTKNGASYSPTVVSATSRNATLAFGDFVVCTITNTGPALTLTKRVDTSAGGRLTPSDWTLSATTSGGVAAISEAPSHSAGSTGNVATASTATVPVPVGHLTLAELGTAAGADWYEAGAWSCTNAGSGTFVLNGSDLTVTAGNSLTCTITNTYVPRPTIALWKTTLGTAGGPFPFTLTNTVQTTGEVTTSAAGKRTQVDGDTTVEGVQTFTVAGFDTEVTIEEAVDPASGWVLADASCSDGTSTVGTLAGGTYTIPASEIVAGAQITCDFSNRPAAGTATWSKRDAGDGTTLLAGSEWTLTGPSHPDGVDVTDCVAAAATDCTGPDTDPAAGVLTVAGLAFGSYTVVETSAPVGFQLDPTPHAFAIETDGQTVDIGGITNQRSPVPALPLTGGASADAFLLSGIALLATAGLGGWLHRRRLLRSS